YPQRRALIGIQPLSIDWGEAPSEPVARALPEAGRRVMALIERWDRE
ncbi:MAG: hydrogenase maturation protease, partial [Candidatus Sedimenticola endophacoides]